MKYSIVFKLLIITVFLSPSVRAAEGDSGELQKAIAELREMVLNQQAEIRAQQAEIESLKNRIETQGEELKAVSAEGYRNSAVRFPARAKEGAEPVKVPDTPAAPVESSVTSKYGIDFYGYIKADGVYTSQDVVTDTVPFYVRPGNGSNGDYQFNMSAKESRLGAKLGGPEFGGGKLTGLVEVDFYGDFADVNSRHAYKLRTRQLYLRYGNEDWNLLAGKTWETYMATFPQTLNFSYYNLMGQLGLRKTQVRLTKNQQVGEDQNLTLKVALAEPVGGLHGADLDEDLVDDGAESDMPTLEYQVSYTAPVMTEKPSQFSLSGFYGRETADTSGDGSDQDFDSYAIIGGLTFPLTDKLALKGTLWTGTNLDGAWGGIGQGINALTGETIDSVGGWIQLGYQATEKLKFNIGYSMDNPKDSDLNVGDRSDNSSYLVNAFYSFIPEFILGLEYMRLETGYKGEADEATDWLQTSLIFKF